MVDVQRQFAKEPPKEPMVSLEAVVRDFNWRFKKRKKTDQVVNYCRLAPNFAAAVSRAVEARDAKGKHHNHQSKVDLESRRELGNRIVISKKHMLSAMNMAKDTWYTQFDAMYDFIDSVKPKGIGPVTVYDVAVRIGAFLEVEPDSVYVHAGVRQGIRALEDLYTFWALAVDPPRSWKELRTLQNATTLSRVPRYCFPPALRRLKADDIEDILCTYRSLFVDWYKELDSYHE